MLWGAELALAFITVFVGATVMGTVSFGLGLVVTPVLLLLLEPQSTVVIVNSLIGILLTAVLIHLRNSFDLRLIGWTALAGLAAVPVGVVALNSAGPTVLRLIIGLVILMLVPFVLFNIELPGSRRRPAGPVVGFLTSLSVITLTIGGPLVAIYAISQRWPRDAMRAALAFYFMVANALAFILYSWAGLVDRDTLANIGILLPAVILGFGVASVIARRINDRVFRYAAVGVIVAGGCVLLGKELARLLGP